MKMKMIVLMIMIMKSVEIYRYTAKVEEEGGGKDQDRVHPPEEQADGHLKCTRKLKIMLTLSKMVKCLK